MVEENKVGTKIEDKVAKVKNDLKNTIDLNEIEKFIKKESIEFEFEGVTYKVRQPTFDEKQEAFAKKSEKYTQLLTELDASGNPKYQTEEDLIKIYAKRGISIAKLDDQIVQYELKKNDLMLKLGESLKAKVDEKELKPLRDEIARLQEEQYSISLKKMAYLQYSIESQVMVFVYSYIVWKTTEKKIKGKDLGEGNKEPDTWVRAWDKFEDFKKEKDELIQRASYYSSLIVGKI